MHTCPDCGRICDCDLEDSECSSREWVEANCLHPCEEERDEDEDGEDNGDT